MTSQPGYQTIAIHIVLNISRRKGNQTIKFGQAIEYHKRNTFLFSFNWDSLHARLNSQYQAWSYTGNLFRKNLQLTGVC